MKNIKNKKLNGILKYSKTRFYGNIKGIKYHGDKKFYWDYITIDINS